MLIFSKNVVGIEFNDYSAQVVELRSNGNKISLEAYNRILVPSQVVNNGDITKPDDLKAVIEVLLKRANPHPINSKDIAIVFPPTKLFTHVFSFSQNMEPSDIARLLPYEAEKVIPFSIDDVYWDFCFLGDKKKVLFVSITKKTADDYVNFFWSMGFNPFLFGTDVETLKDGLSGQIPPNRNSLILDIGFLSSNSLVTKNKKLKHFFSPSKGGKHLVSSLSKEFEISENSILLEKEKGVFQKKYSSHISRFIKNSYVTAKEDLESTGLEVDDIYLTGDFLNLPDFYQIARECFLKKTIYIGSPGKSVNINPKKFASLNENEDSFYYSTYFTKSIGVALQGLNFEGKNNINIVPDALKKDERNRKRNLFFVLTSAFMSIILIFVSAFIISENQNLTYEKKFLEIEEAGIMNVLKGSRYQEIMRLIEGFNREVSGLHNIENRLFDFPSLIDDITALLPDGIILNSFKFLDSDMTLEISGVASTRDVLWDTVQTLKQAVFISDVTTPFSIYDSRTDIAFTMSLDLIFNQLPAYGSSSN